MSEHSAVETAFLSLSEHLQEATEALATVRTQDEVLALMLHPALAALNARAGTVLLVDADGTHLQVAATEGYEWSAQTIWQGGPLDGHVLAGAALNQRQPLFFEQPGDLIKRFPQLEQRISPASPVATAILPLFLEDQLLGAIILDFSEPHAFTAAEKRFLRILTAQCPPALGRLRVLTELETQVTRRTQAAVEDRAALDAFVAYTEAIGTETEVAALAQHAVDVLRARFADCSGGYYGRSGSQWTLRTWTDDLNERPEFLALLRAGLPSETPFIDDLLRTREPIFTEQWDAQDEGIEDSEVYGTVAAYPVIVGQEMRGFITLGLKDTAYWSERDRTIFKAVGRGMSLALERSAQSSRIRIQNAELGARTRALEGFAELTRDLAVQEDPSVLIHRAQQVVLSLLPEGYCLYFEPDLRREFWILQAQTGDLRNDDLQAAAHAGLPYGSAGNLLIPYTTLEPYYQEEYAQDLDQLDGMVSHLGASATLPVLVRGQPKGVFAVILFGTLRPWSTAERAVMETVVRSLGLALERSQGITELAERSRELEQANHDLQAANEELEAFTYSASHDLRTPVRHVMGFAELAQKALEKTPNEKAQRYLDVVKQGAVRMSALIDGMLVLSRSGRQELKVQPVDLNALVTQARRDVGAEFAGHPVRWRISELPQVQGDQEMLQQVMTNLLSNAVKYSANREQSEVEVWCEESASAWTISIQDNGVGFDPAYAQKLFGLFQRLHSEREFQGTGVGLATVRRIVLKHGGQVAAESQERFGATFRFTLPKMR